MKHQNDKSLDETSLSIQQNLTRKCVQANLASLVCYDNECEKIAFICGGKECKCYKEHRTCPQLLIQSIMNKIQSKIVPFEHFQKSILDKIDKTINQLSELKVKLQTQIKQDFTLYGLTIKDKNLLQLLKKQKISGKQLFKAFHQSINLQNKFVQKESIDAKFAELWRFVDEEIKSKSTQFYKFLNYYGPNKENYTLFKDSKIVTDKQNEENLINMFGNNLPRSAKLLYRASQHNFKTDKFHQKCDNIPHTVTLCETVYGKVIGGYTPLVWDKSKRGFVKDETEKSFIFSLTNNDKFILKHIENAIYQRVDCGPIFGQNDFYISEAANTSSNNSRTQLNTYYFNQNYTKGNGDSYMRFTGNPDKTYYYRPKEWQVWQLKF